MLSRSSPSVRKRIPDHGVRCYLSSERSLTLDVPPYVNHGPSFYSLSGSDVTGDSGTRRHGTGFYDIPSVGWDLKRYETEGHSVLPLSFVPKEIVVLDRGRNSLPLSPTAYLSLVVLPRSRDHASILGYGSSPLHPGQ